ncbi:transmembrane protein 268 isoform X2 [Amblyraja radiata]|uniref:transmembrane protein 268 isoform X2 n=1 Tax=Amblyraja radiata TaxID=386614 RepID=UPI00140293D2|nr:transmembrane protein 268 isoform X2 [Amblyraja radiata]
MARCNGGESISSARSSVTSLEAVEEADLIHWINDPNGLGSISGSSSSNDPECYSSSERPVLYNGRTLLVLASGGPWWTRGFDLESCEEGLSRFGIQIPPEVYKLPIQATLMSSEVRRYMYFSSSGFMMLFTPINANTDLRLMWTNENLVKHNILVGAMDATKYCSSVLHLCFIYFNIRGCERRLASLLESRRHAGSGLQSLLREKLGHLYIVIETTQVSALNEVVAGSEEAPLLPGNDGGSPSHSSHQPKHVFDTLTSLVPEGTSEEIAYQLLVIYSGYYVKLLAMNQLPHTTASIHTGDAHVPCLCQYIETSILKLSGCES